MWQHETVFFRVIQAFLLVLLFILSCITFQNGYDTVDPCNVGEDRGQFPHRFVYKKLTY